MKTTKKEELKNQTIDKEFEDVQLPQQLIKREHIENTPFEAIELEENKGMKFIALGNHVLTEPKFKSMKEIQAYLKTNVYEFMLKVSFIAVKSIKE